MSDQPFVFGVPLPPEVAQRIQENQARQQMQVDDIAHQREEFFDGLTQEQNNILMLILGVIAQAGDPASVASYYQGVCRTYAKLKFNVCPGCGMNHDEQLQRLNENTGPVSDPTAEKLLKEYSLKLASPDAIVTMDTPVICTGCGLKYFSIRDRILKPPGMDGCHGCQEKSARG